MAELRHRNPISQIVGQRIKLVKKGREFQGLCPFHTEKSPSFTVNDDKEFYHCFGCGAHGDAISFLTEIERMSFFEAVEFLAQQSGLPMPRDNFVRRAIANSATGRPQPPAPQPENASASERRPQPRQSQTTTAMTRTPKMTAKMMARIMTAKIMVCRLMICAKPWPMRRVWYQQQLADKIGNEARHYLKQRGLSPADYRAIFIGLCPRTQWRSYRCPDRARPQPGRHDAGRTY